MNSPTHNIVLSFNDKTNSGFVQFAQDKFSSISDGYCLSEIVIPHVTLAQINLANFSAQEDLIASLSSINPENICLNPEGFAFRYGSSTHTGKIWIEIIIQKTKALLDVHNDVCKTLEIFDLKPLNAYGKNYHPHITFCRMSLDHQIPQILLPQNFVHPIKKPFLCFGESDPNGQLLSILWKSS